MGIMRQITISDYQALDPEKVWVFKCESDEQCIGVIQALHEWQELTGKEVFGFVMPSGMTVEELPLEVLEEMVERIKQEREGVAQ
jgi:hypothetical protein